jgi:hypothetical protein
MISNNLQFFKTMKRIRLAGIFSVVFLLSGSIIIAQEKACEVKMPSISGKYSGDCKNGLAHGRGSDKYYGQFIKGLPDGKGTYTWADGTYYEGQWKDGMKEGKGKMVYADSTVTGYWKMDRFVGEKLTQPYKITRSISVARSSFTKLTGTNNFIRLKFTRGGIENADITDFSLAYTSGDEFRMGPSYGIQHCQFPLDVIVRFRAWNYFHTTQFDVNFEFTINEAADWEVVVSY